MEKILKSEILYAGRKFTVKRLTVELQPGVLVDWEVVDKGSNSVAMVPVDDQGNVYLVEEYFAATNERTLCLPKGTINAGETDEEAALRELQEEIGVRGKLTKLVSMSVSPGYLTQRTTVFLATDLEKSTLPREEEQYLEAVVMPFSEAISKIKSGEITEARTIGGLALAGIVLGQH